jgi:uncharacterized protein DUF4267
VVGDAPGVRRLPQRNRGDPVRSRALDGEVGDVPQPNVAERTAPVEAHDRPEVEFGLAAVLGLFLLFLALRGFVAPAEAASGFGIPVVDSADLFYLRVKADRDLTSAAALLLLIALRERRALAAFVGVATVQPLCDLALSLTDARGHAGFALAVHGSGAVYCVGDPVKSCGWQSDGMATFPRVS